MQVHLSIFFPSFFLLLSPLCYARKQVLKWTSASNIWMRRGEQYIYISVSSYLLVFEPPNCWSALCVLFCRGTRLSLCNSGTKIHKEEKNSLVSPPKSDRSMNISVSFPDCSAISPDQIRTQRGSEKKFVFAGPYTGESGTYLSPEYRTKMTTFACIKNTHTYTKKLPKYGKFY